MIRIDGLAWDEDAEEHIGRHNVTVQEVEDAVQNIRYAKRSREHLLLIGQTDEGRYLVVVLDYEGSGYWYPVTARDAQASERRLANRDKSGKGRRRGNR